MWLGLPLVDMGMTEMQSCFWSFSVFEVGMLCKIKCCGLSCFWYHMVSYQNLSILQWTM
jgi:hypothetical protein